MLNILLVDDNRDDRALAIHELKRAFPEVLVREAGTAAQFAEAITEANFNVVITDYQLHWSNGLTLLKTIKAHYPNCPVIMFTNTATQEIAIEAMKSGLDDYVIKSPHHYVRLPTAVQGALQRIEAQQQAASLQARVQSLLNQLNVGIYRLTLEGDLLEGNPAFLRLIGLGSLTEIPANQTLEPYFKSQDYAEFLTQLKQNGEVRDREIQLCCADGTTRWVRVSKTFTKVQGKTIIDGLIEDISDRKQAEAQAEIEKQRSEFLAEASRLLASFLDYDTTLKALVNMAVPTLADICIVDVVEPTSLKLSEPILAASELEQKTLVLEIRRRYPPLADAHYGVAKVLRTGKPELRSYVSTTFEKIAQDTQHLDLLQRLDAKASLIVPIMMRERKFGAISLILTKGNRTYENADLEMALELARRTATALDNARLYQQAQAANQIKDEFLAIVSHELRNPLNSMLGWATLLRKRHFDDPTLSRALEIIERNAKLQNKLIEDLLDVSRIIQKKLRILRQPVQIIPIIDAVIETLQPTAQTKFIELESTLDSNIGQVIGDAERLEQVIWNLLSNAIKFTPTGGKVNIELKQVNSFAQLTITDTGLGIRPEFLPFVFEPFRQADASKTRSQGGLGLGLAIVRHLVELHDGNVYVSSEGEGKGATFTVQLPIEEYHQLCLVNTRQPENLSALGGVKILVVDDDLDNRELIAFILEQYQAQVTRAASAAEGFQLFTQSSFDILICDIGMPEEDGYSLMRRIRKLPSEQKRLIPAIALTAFAKAEDRQEAIAAGFQRHLSKPIHPEDLIEVVASIARLLR